MEMKLTKEDKDQILLLNDLLKLKFSKEELETARGIKRLLLNAWWTSNRRLHDVGFSRLKIASLCSRAIGFERFILRRSISINRALSDALC